MASPESNHVGGARASGGVKNLLAMFEKGGQTPPAQGLPSGTPKRETSPAPKPLSRVRTSFVAVGGREGQIGLQRVPSDGMPSPTMVRSPSTESRPSLEAPKLAAEEEPSKPELKTVTLEKPKADAPKEPKKLVELKKAEELKKADEPPKTEIFKKLEPVRKVDELKLVEEATPKKEFAALKKWNQPEPPAEPSSEPVTPRKLNAAPKREPNVTPSKPEFPAFKLRSVRKENVLNNDEPKVNALELTKENLNAMVEAPAAVAQPIPTPPEPKNEDKEKPAPRKAEEVKPKTEEVKPKAEETEAKVEDIAKKVEEPVRRKYFAPKPKEERGRSTEVEVRPAAPLKEEPAEPAPAESAAKPTKDTNTKKLTVPTSQPPRGRSPAPSPRVSRSPAPPRSPHPPRSPLRQSHRTPATSPQKAEKKPKSRQCSAAPTTRPRQSTATSGSLPFSHTRPEVVIPHKMDPKPEPKEPTRPIALRGTAFAPTAAWLAKHGPDPLVKQSAQPSPRASRSPPSRIIRRQKSSISDHSRENEPRAQSPPCRPATSAANRPGPRTSTGSTASAVPSSDFLTRMMRPTRSSATKVHEKKEPERKFQPSLRAGSAAGNHRTVPSPPRRTVSNSSRPPHVVKGPPMLRMERKASNQSAHSSEPKSPNSIPEDKEIDEPVAPSRFQTAAQIYQAPVANRETFEMDNTTRAGEPVQALSIKTEDPDPDRPEGKDGGGDTPTTTASSSTLVHDEEGGDSIPLVEEVAKE